MNDLLALDANTSTALTIIATGVIIPAVSAIINRPTFPAAYKRWVVIALAAVGAVLIMLLQADGPFAEQLVTYLVMLATLIGIAQALYAVMPSVWKEVEDKTSPAASNDSIDGKGR